jgi:hypothetical protein
MLSTLRERGPLWAADVFTNVIAIIVFGLLCWAGKVTPTETAAVVLGILGVGRQPPSPPPAAVSSGDDPPRRSRPPRRPPAAGVATFISSVIALLSRRAAPAA